MTMNQSTAIDFKAMAKGVRAGGIAIGMEATRLAGCGESDRAEELNNAASNLGELASQLEAWRQEQEQLRRVPISAAAILGTLHGLDLHQAGLMRLAESLEGCGLGDGDIEQVRNHARALEGMREDLALSTPEDLEEES